MRTARSIFQQGIDPMTGQPYEDDPMAGPPGAVVDPATAPLDVQPAPEPGAAQEPLDAMEPMEGMGPEEPEVAQGGPSAVAQFAQSMAPDVAEGTVTPDAQEVKLEDEYEAADMEAEKSEGRANKAKAIGMLASGFAAGGHKLDFGPLDQKVQGKRDRATARQEALDKYRKAKGDKEKEDYQRSRDAKGDDERKQDRATALSQHNARMVWDQQRAAKEDSERDESQAFARQQHADSMGMSRAQLAEQRRSRMADESAAQAAAGVKASQEQRGRIDKAKTEFSEKLGAARNAKVYAQTLRKRVAAGKTDGVGATQGLLVGPLKAARSPEGHQNRQLSLTLAQQLAIASQGGSARNLSDKDLEMYMEASGLSPNTEPEAWAQGLAKAEAEADAKYQQLLAQVPEEARAEVESTLPAPIDYDKLMQDAKAQQGRGQQPQQPPQQQQGQPQKTVVSKQRNKRTGQIRIRYSDGSEEIQ